MIGCQRIKPVRKPTKPNGQNKNILISGMNIFCWKCFNYCLTVGNSLDILLKRGMKTDTHHIRIY